MNDDYDKILIDSSRYRDVSIIKGIVNEIHNVAKREWNIMEVCGGQTYALAHYRLEELLPDNIHMIHGPGCPVCVTPVSIIDNAIELAGRQDIIMCSFGDMMRVPGTGTSLLGKKAEGADIRILYSPLDIIEIATKNPDKEVVFLAIGFETTTPIYALMIRKAEELGLHNISLLTSLYTVPPAVRALAADPDCKIDALLGAGHVCAISGLEPYKELSEDLHIPVIVTGFEPIDLLYGILLAIRQLENGKSYAENGYKRVVSCSGNLKAQEDIAEIFETASPEWRGLGIIPYSGLKIAKKYEHFDSSKRYKLTNNVPIKGSLCISGDIMKGIRKPCECEYFGTLCTPEHPVGAPMVSGEGVCSAYYNNR